MRYNENSTVKFKKGRRVEKKSILITGSTGGIGHATAIMLKERGHRVFATARKISDVEELKTQGFESFLLDVDRSESIKTAIDHILSLTGGKLDAIFNNAGYMQVGAIEDLSRELDRAQFETNVFGPMELIRLILPVMRTQGHGRIIQNSSIMGSVTLPFYGDYCASKFALEGFSKSLQQELRQTNIHVSIICPGPTLSRLRENAHRYFHAALPQAKDSEHEESYKKLERNYFDLEKQKNIAQHPDKVAKKVVHALESKHPKSHYYVGPVAKSLANLKRLLPESTFDWLVSKLR